MASLVQIQTALSKLAADTAAEAMAVKAALDNLSAQVAALKGSQTGVAESDLDAVLSSIQSVDAQVTAMIPAETTTAPSTTPVDGTGTAAPDAPSAS